MSRGNCTLSQRDLSESMNLCRRHVTKHVSFYVTGSEENLFRYISCRSPKFFLIKGKNNTDISLNVSLPLTFFNFLPSFLPRKTCACSCVTHMSYADVVFPLQLFSCSTISCSIPPDPAFTRKYFKLDKRSFIFFDML